MKTKVSISIPKKLLKNIEQNIEGSSRSEKIVKCIEQGYQVLTKEHDKISKGIFHIEG